MKATLIRKGFTIVELLVVVAILIALAALVFTMSGRGNEAAKSAATLANLREIGVGAAGWMSDNNSFFPPAWDNTQGKNRSWAQVLDPYVNGQEDYREKDSRFIGPNKRVPVEVNSYSHPITYSMNAVVAEVYNTDRDLAKNLIHVTQVERLSDVILCVDGCQNPGNLGQANATFYRVQIGKSGPVTSHDELIPVGPDVDEGSADGWIRYPYGKAHALMCDGSTRTFEKGTIAKGNLWLDIDRSLRSR